MPQPAALIWVRHDHKTCTMKLSNTADQSNCTILVTCIDASEDKSDNTVANLLLFAFAMHSTKLVQYIANVNNNRLSAVLADLSYYY